MVDQTSSRALKGDSAASGLRVVSHIHHGPCKQTAAANANANANTNTRGGEKLLNFSAARSPHESGGIKRCCVASPWQQG